MKTSLVSATVLLMTGVFGCSSGTENSANPMVNPGNNGGADAMGAAGGANIGGDGSVLGAAGGAAVTPPANVGAISCTPGVNEVLPVGLIRRLSRGGYAASMQAALGYAQVDPSALPTDPQTADKLDTAASLTTISPEYAEAYYAHGETAAAAAVGTMAEQCITQDAAALDACITTFVTDMGKRFFRRPLEADEIARYTAAYQLWKTTYTAQEATEMLLRAWAMSPNFLYRTEIGSGAPGEVKLTPYEIASQLSYTFTNAPPDELLMADADAGTLVEPAVALSHAQRLVNTPGARLVLRDFFSQVLSFREAIGQYKQLAPAEQTASLIPSMLEDSLTFVEKVVWEKGGGLEALLTATYSYPDAALAQFYGVAPSVGGVEVETNRVGLLNQAAFLTSIPGFMRRGKTLRTDVLCTPTLEPPAGVAEAAKLIDFGYAEDDTAREHVEKLTAKIDPGCISCHAGFMPLGLTFEHYDDTGAFRETEFGKALDTSAVITGFGDLDGPVADSAELATKIAKSNLGQFCFAKRFVTYAQGRTPSNVDDGCLITSVRETLSDPQLSLTEMMVALAQDPGFFTRINAQ